MAAGIGSDTMQGCVGQMLRLINNIDNNSDDVPEGMKGPNKGGECSCKWKSLLQWFGDEYLAATLAEERTSKGLTGGPGGIFTFSAACRDRNPTVFFTAKRETLLGTLATEGLGGSRTRSSVAAVVITPPAAQSSAASSTASMYRTYGKLSNEIVRVSCERIAEIENDEMRCKVGALVLKKLRKQFGPKTTHATPARHASMDTAIVDSIRDSIGGLKAGSRGSVGTRGTLLLKALVGFSTWGTYSWHSASAIARRLGISRRSRALRFARLRVAAGHVQECRQEDKSCCD